MSFLVNPFRFAAAPAAGTAWNPADKGADVVLSNSNRTAAAPGAGQLQGVRGDSFKNSGSLHLEMTMGALTETDNAIIGLGTASALLTNGTSTAGSALAGFTGFLSGRFYHTNGTAFTGVTPPTAGQTVAFEITSTQIWYKIGTSARQGPFTHGLASYTPLLKFGSGATNGELVTLNTGQAAFIIAVEPGFVAFG